MSGPKLAPRFDIAPIERMVGDRDDVQLLTVLTRPSTANAIANATGTTRSTVQQWRGRGLSVEQADRSAVALGVHVTELWPDFYDDLYRSESTDR